MKILRSGELVLDDISEIGVTKGLVAYYPLRVNAKDYSGNKYNGTINGAVPVPGGFDGSGAFEFDASNSSPITVDNFYNPNSSNPVFLGTPPSSSNNWNGNCTYSVWAKYEADDTTNRHIIADNNHNEGYIRCRNDRVIANMSSGTTATFITNEHINTWSHFLFTHTRDDSNDLYTVSLYLNGRLVRQSNTAISSSSSSYGPDNRLVIGNSWIGKIAGLKIFDRALTPEEIAIEYKQTGKSKVTQHKGTYYLQGQFKETL